MKKVVLLILLVICEISTYKLWSQSKFQSGYIVTNQNDTIYGQLRDRKPEPFGKVFKKVQMKSFLIFKKKFGPKDIHSYTIGDRTYESIWYDSYTELFTVFHRSIPNEGKKIFMQLTVAGAVKLYWDYFKDPADGFEINIPFFKKSNSGELIRVTQGIFGFKKKRLANFFSDCPELIQKMHDGYFKTPEEMAIFYNLDCSLK